MTEPGHELEPAAAPVPEVVDPISGELVALTAPTDQLADVIDSIRQVEERFKSEKRAIGDELIRRMDAEATWTHRAGGYKITAPSPKPKDEWDGERLHAVLVEYVEADVISVRAAGEAVEQETVYKPRVAGINKLLKLGGDLAEAILACRTQVPPDRRVRVTPER